MRHDVIARRPLAGGRGRTHPCRSASHYATNGLNQYTGAGAATFTYDSKGNLTGDGTTTFTYDRENRLRSATGSINLSYSPNGQLNQVQGPAGGVQFLNDGDEMVAEHQSGTNALLRRYVHGPSADDPVIWYEGPGLTDRRSLQVDAQGSVVSVADAAGNALGVNGYDDHGIPNGLLAGRTPNLGRFQYTGQTWIPELGLYHYKARLYSPTLGRFLQTDPIGYGDQINLYAYVGNDPVNGTDPSGMAEANTCSRVGGSACSGSYAGDGTASQWTTRRTEQIYDRAAKRGDAYASTAKEFGKNDPENGDIARSKAALFKTLLIRNGAQILRKGEGPLPIDFLSYDKKVRLAALFEYRAIREDLAVTYDRVMRSDGNGRASVNQVYDIHLEVFGRHNIPMTAFGGSPVFGSRTEAILTSPAWCPGCLGQ